MWQEHSQGKDAANQAIAQTYKGLLSPKAPPSAGRPRPRQSFSSRYTPAASWPDALRARLGDDLLFNILRTYAKRYYHANATTADFIM